jgi:hypothetical protein
MDVFGIIQQFFTRMTCHHCQASLEPDGVRLLREDAGMFVVSITCNHCHNDIGVALVGMDAVEGHGHPGQSGARRVRVRRYKDPELTPEELRRLAVFEPVSDDDVIEAHHFFQNLDTNWMRYIPDEMKHPLVVANPPAESVVEA